MRRRGFTLIELMVVIVIIGILLGLLMPAFLRARRQSKKVEARADAQTLISAVKAYFQEYGEWPCPDAERVGVWRYTERNDEIVKRIRVNAPGNVKRILFLEEEKLRTDGDGTVVTAWGEPFQVVIDTRYPAPECTIASGVEVRVPQMDRDGYE